MFKENITKSIDNLNEIEKNIRLIFGDEIYDKIEKLYDEHVIQKTGTKITIHNTLQNGKFDWHLVGNVENGIPVTGFNQIELTNKDESYVETFDLHLGNIELAAVDNYKDRIVGIPNNWKILKNVEKNSDGTYSILEITQEIPIIDATLNYELNHLYFNAIAYEGQTNIESIPESGNATMIIDVDAFVTKKEE